MGLQDAFSSVIEQTSKTNLDRIRVIRVKVFFDPCSVRGSIERTNFQMLGFASLLHLMHLVHLLLLMELIYLNHSALHFEGPHLESLHFVDLDLKHFHPVHPVPSSHVFSPSESSLHDCTSRVFISK